MWASVLESLVFCRMTRLTEGYEDDGMSWARWFERRRQMEFTDASVKKGGLSTGHFVVYFAADEIYTLQ